MIHMKSCEINVEIIENIGSRILFWFYLQYLLNDKGCDAGLIQGHESGEHGGHLVAGGEVRGGVARAVPRAPVRADPQQHAHRGGVAPHRGQVQRRALGRVLGGGQLNFINNLSRYISSGHDSDM